MSKRVFTPRRGDQFKWTDAATWYQTEADARAAASFWNLGQNAEAIAVPTVSVGHLSMGDPRLADFWCVVVEVVS